MQRAVISFLSGGLFGAGLVISQMTNPMKVVSFLDVFGNWDPSLAFVMGGALLVTLLGYRFVLGQEKPLFEGKFHLPTSKDIDGRLVSGALFFGVGWGLSGLCPGPALAISSYGGEKIFYFLFGLLISIGMFRWISARKA